MVDMIEKEDISQLVLDLRELGIPVKELVKRLDKLGWQNLRGEIQQTYNQLKGKGNIQNDLAFNQNWRAAWVGNYAFAGNSGMPNSRKYDFRPILYRTDRGIVSFLNPTRIDYRGPLSVLERYLRENLSA